MAVAVSHRQQLFKHPSRQASYPLPDDVHADRLQVAQPDFYGGNREIVQRAVFQGRLA